MGKGHQRVLRSLDGDPGIAGLLSTELFQLALHHLEIANKDKTDSEIKSSENHYTKHVLGCIVMLASGMEALLSTLIWVRLPSEKARPTNDKETDKAQNKINERVEEMKDLLARGTFKEKYKHFLKKGQHYPQDMATLFNVRNEIIHFIPTRHTTMPTWLATLEDQNILLGDKELPPDDLDFTFNAKLCSYKLALWAFKAVEDAIIQLTDNKRILKAKLRADLKLIQEYQEYTTVSKADSN